MSLIPNHVQQMLEKLRGRSDVERLSERLAPVTVSPSALPVRSRTDAETIRTLWERIDASISDSGGIKASLSPSFPAENYAGNIESFIGAVEVPVGVIGPLQVNGLNASGGYFIPLATSEAALVASYARGADIATRAGGISAAMLSEGLLRTPAFVFQNIHDSGLFVTIWKAGFN